VSLFSFILAHKSYVQIAQVGTQAQSTWLNPKQIADNNLLPGNQTTTCILFRVG
jgi:hypothetical protein